MPFPWLHPDVPADVESRGRNKLQHDEMVEAEYRARLYYSLGYSLAEAKKRVTQNASWEWELQARYKPGHHGKLGKRVEQIYAMESSATSAKPAKRK
jgi:hypothetical protein